VNEEVKEITAKKEEGRQKMNRKAMSKVKTNFLSTEQSDVITEEAQANITNQNAR